MNAQTLPLSEDFIRQFEELRLRVRSSTAAGCYWRNILTDEDKRQLGSDLSAAWQEGGTVRMWMKLHKCDDPILATVELATEIGLLDAPRRQFFLRNLGLARPIERDENKPQWDKESRELRFRGVVVRQVPNPGAAKNIVTVLDALQEQGWPPRIDDPLPGGRNQTRLHATIRSLNNGLTEIAFSADGTGKGYRWQARPL